MAAPAAPAANVKVAVVTGASSGIGRAAALELAKDGWSVVLVGRDRARLAETVALSARPATHLVCAGDVTDEAFAVRVFADAVERYGRVDVLFNNAGVGAPVLPVDELTLAAFEAVIKVNLTACFLFTREAFKAFKAQVPQGGRIINNGSLSAHVPRPHSLPYAVSKHAVSGLTKATALDGRPFNITATQIDIGNAATALAFNKDPAARAASAAAGTALPPTISALQPGGAHAPEPTIDTVHVARAVAHIAALPLEVAVLEMNIMAAGMPYVGRG